MTTKSKVRRQTSGAFARAFTEAMGGEYVGPVKRLVGVVNFVVAMWVEIALSAAVFRLYWKWFLLPATGLEVPSFWLVVGITMMLALMLSRERKLSGQEYPSMSWTDRQFHSIGAAVGRPIGYWVVGVIINIFASGR